MAASTRLYDNLPIYGKLADSTGLLAFFCDKGIQPQIDIFLRLIAQQDHFYDPDFIFTGEHLEWLGQFIGLASLEDHYLGIGINLNWDDSQKRIAILEAWNYWSIKGSLAGVRKGVQIWTGWDKALDNQNLSFLKPFENIQKWWGYDTPFGSSLNDSFLEQKQLGSGDFLPGKDYQPWWKQSENDAISKPDRIPLSRSHLGSRNIWCNFHFNLGEPIDLEGWNRIFPNFHTLSYEIFDAQTSPSPIAWLHGDEYINFAITTRHQLQGWLVKVSTSFTDENNNKVDRIYQVRAMSLNFEDEDGVKHPFYVTDSIVKVEFILRVANNCTIDAIELDSGSASLFWSELGLSADPRINIGINFSLQTNSSNIPNRKAIALDLPLLADEDIDNGLYVGATSSNPNQDDFLSVYLSKNSSAFLNTDLIFKNTPIGNVTNIPDLNSAPTIVDNASSILVTFPEDRPLFSISDDDFYQLKNLALVGNELIAFKDVENISNGQSYILSNLLRGCRGTEQKISQHITGERFVLLKSDGNDYLQRIPTLIDDIGKTFKFKSTRINSGDPPLNSMVSSAIVSGEGIRPYAPNDLRAAKLTQSILIEWRRRYTRREDWNNFQTPPPASFKVNILNNNIVVRTTTVTTNYFNYSNANLINDFGSFPNSFTYQVWQTGIVPGKRATGYYSSQI